MIVQVGIENNFEGRSIAWALEHPGCYAYGPTGERALAGLADAVFEYADWIAVRNHQEAWLEPGELEFYLDGTFDDYFINEQFDLSDEQGYEVDGWFLYDWKPLTEPDVACGLRLLSWTRDDLLDVTQDLDPASMTRLYPGERWNIQGILSHVSGGDWWYLDRLGLAPAQDDLPAEPFKRLEYVRKVLVQALPALVGVNRVLGVDGEFWSPRKLLRRAVWHERDHTLHIRKLLLSS